MDKEILNQINEALDYAMASFKDDPDIIYQNEKERQALKYSNENKTNSWKKKQTCIYNNCSNRSIAKSHTIQKSSSIKLISESSHVLRPKFNDKLGKIELVYEGIGDASTFPGFCLEHEGLFEEFENKKDLETEVHFILQLYRTMCREIVICEHNLLSLKTSVNQYIEFRNKKVNEIFRQNLGEDFFIKNNIKSKSFELKNGDHRETQAIKGVRNIEDYLLSLTEFKNAIENDLSKKKFQKIYCITISVDVLIPVCIAGRGNFDIKPKSKIKNIEVLFNVLPHNNKTYIIICSLKRNIRELNTYMDQYKNPLQIISLIESWMIHGSDHWFIKPSVWNNIDKTRQEKIQSDILDISKNIAHEYSKSIFDDLRKASIKLMEDNYSELNEPLIHLLNKEKTKLTSSI